MTARVDHSPAPAPFIVGLVLVSSALFFALGMDVRLNVYDEGVILTGAMRVAAGEVPHRDFYANYGPAAFFLPAALFKIFGQYALIERVLDTLTRAGIVTLCYALCATQARTSIALATALISGLWLFRVQSYGYPIFPVVLISLVSCALVMPALSGVLNTRRLAGAGATVGVIALFRYDVGFFIFVAIACALTVSVVLGHANRRERLRRSMKVLVPYVLGTSVVFLPVAACYLAVAPVRGLHPRRLFLSASILCAHAQPAVSACGHAGLPAHRGMQRRCIQPCSRPHKLTAWRRIELAWNLLPLAQQQSVSAPIELDRRCALSERFGAPGRSARAGVADPLHYSRGSAA